MRTSSPSTGTTGRCVQEIFRLPISWPAHVIRFRHDTLLVKLLGEENALNAACKDKYERSQVRQVASFSAACSTGHLCGGF